MSAAAQAPPPPAKIHRLNYIGSKYQLLEWLTNYMKEKTGFTTFRNKAVADLFAGTGVVSHHFRLQGATVYSNDAELYSAVIAHAFTRSVYTERVRQVIAEMNALATAHAATPPDLSRVTIAPMKAMNECSSRLKMRAGLTR